MIRFFVAKVLNGLAASKKWLVVYFLMASASHCCILEYMGGEINYGLKFSHRRVSALDEWYQSGGKMDIARTSCSIQSHMRSMSTYGEMQYERR